MTNAPNNSRRTRTRLVIAALILSAGLGGVALTPMLGAGRVMGPSDSGESSDLIAVQTISFDITTTASGELEALRQIELRSQLEQDTAITEIVPEGQRVKAGDVLVRLNADSIQTQIEEEQLRVETSRAELATAENNYLIQVSDNESSLAKAKLNVDLAELELNQWLQGEVKSKRQANDLAFERAVRELERLKEKYDRSVTLEQRGFLSRDELKRDEVAYLEAQAALKTAELERTVYDEYQFPKDQKTKQSTLDQAKAELDRTARQSDSLLATKFAERANKRQQLALRDQKLTKYRDQLAAATIKAPSDGLVVYSTSVNRDRWGGSSEGTLDVGRMVKRNASLILLPDTSEMVASVRVHESLSGRIRRGQTVSVKIDALAGRVVPGDVLSVGVIAESGGMRDPNLREYTVKIKLDMTAVDIPLKPSMRCEAEILLDRVTSALAVPIQSVFTDGMVRYVYVPENSGKFRRVPVRAGRRSDRQTEILAGLKEGQRVLVRAPLPGELFEREGGMWDKAELAAVGLNLLADGRIEPIGGMRSPGGGNPAGAPGTGRQRPPRNPDASAPNSTSDRRTPAATPPSAPAPADASAQQPGKPPSTPDSAKPAAPAATPPAK